jgi:hypothetical protein
MLTPPMTGYPVDRTVVQRRQRRRHERRARQQTDSRLSKWSLTRLWRT